MGRDVSGSVGVEPVTVVDVAKMSIIADQTGRPATVLVIRILW